MPYKSIEDIPDSVRQHVPSHAQEIYMKAFNNAWEQYSTPSKRRGGKKESREQVAHKVAWAAVKKKYTKKDQCRKKDTEWTLRAGE